MSACDKAKRELAEHFANKDHDRAVVIEEIANELP